MSKKLSWTSVACLGVVLMTNLLAANCFAQSWSNEASSPNSAGASEIVKADVEGGGTLSVLLVVGDAEVAYSNIRNELAALPEIATVDTFNSTLGTPTLDQLLNYSCVVVWARFSHINPNALGDNLADYVDSGGNVIASTASRVPPDFFIGGRFQTDGYDPLTNGARHPVPSTLGNFVADHPAMNTPYEIRNLFGALRESTSLRPNVDDVARWMDNLPLLAINHLGQVAGDTAILNNGFWTGDWPQLLTNLCLYLAPRLVITTQRLPPSRLGDPYSAELTARGGTPPYTWSLVSGVLPPGLSLNESTGLISGTSTSEGIFEFTIQVQDQTVDTAQAPLRISILDCPVISGLESCQEIKGVCPESKSDIYELEAAAGERYDAYCDMDTNGGGWTLVLAYAHAGGTNGPLRPSVRPLDPEEGFSHYSNAQMERLPFAEARFFCRTSAHARQMHFATSNAGVANYLRFGGANQPGFWSSGFEALSGHSANLPAATDATFSDQGNFAMTQFPFYQYGFYHWGIRGFGGRWECDDADSSQYTTLHQVWVR